MKESTRRALRSGFHGLLTVLGLLPLIAVHVPTGGILAAAVAVLMLVSKGLNTAEDAGLIPSWLKGGATLTEAPAVQPESDPTGHAGEPAPPSTPVEPAPAPEGDAAP